MKITVTKQRNWRYVRNLLVTAFVALIFAFYGIIPIYYDVAHEPKTLWARPEAGHIDALFAHPQAYEEKVIDFFNQALLENR